LRKNGLPRPKREEISRRIGSSSISILVNINNEFIRDKIKNSGLLEGQKVKGIVKFL